MTSAKTPVTQLWVKAEPAVQEVIAYCEAGRCPNVQKSPQSTLEFFNSFMKYYIY